MLVAIPRGQFVIPRCSVARTRWMIARALQEFSQQPRLAGGLGPWP